MKYFPFFLSIYLFLFLRKVIFIEKQFLNTFNDFSTPIKLYLLQEHVKLN